MLQVLLRSQHALRTQASRQAARAGLRKCASLPCIISRNLSRTSRLWQDDGVEQVAQASAPVAKLTVKRDVPVFCPGCGAPSQTIDSNSAGFYGEKQVRQRDDRRKQEDTVYAAAFAGGAFDVPKSDGRPTVDKGTPVCDRCHNLQYQSTGQSIIHPTTDSIRAIIDESPHRYNNIYHVLDAADFPMSLIPNLTSALHLPRLRTQNRRAKNVRYSRDRIAEVNFIITRSDLLAPKKEQVDKLLPYVQDVLRDALGRTRKNVRLGSVRLVSAKRGWWTKTVKEEIYRRGGGGWMVGKVNVGKSALVEAVFPKGRLDVNVGKLYAAANGQRGAAEEPEPSWPVIEERPASQVSLSTGVPPPTQPFEGAKIPFELELEQTAADTVAQTKPSATEETTAVAHGEDAPEAEARSQDHDEEEDLFDETDMSLLPPAQPEVAYPTMPVVSALPGTTASPIRLPFGNGRGELVDLPGIQRSILDTYVKEESRKSMIMKHRIVPEQYSVKPGQSLILGGLIRITPKTDDLVFLMYGFLPTALAPHVTSTEKAIAIQTGAFTTGEAYEGNVVSNATDAAKLSIKSAGSYRLRWDVTKARAGPVTDKVAGKQKASTLPYIVYALDLLIEGVGWVEVVAQVRRKHVEQASMMESTDPLLNDEIARHESHLPEIEVFSPRGQFVGVRRPMNGWLLGGPKKTPVHLQKARPRHSMSYQRRVQGGRTGSLRKAALDV